MYFPSGSNFFPWILGLKIRKKGAASAPEPVPIDGLGVCFSRHTCDNRAGVSLSQVQFAATLCKIGGKTLQAVVQPPTQGAPGLP
jgi:hypothetical protein